MILYGFYRIVIITNSDLILIIIIIIILEVGFHFSTLPFFEYKRLAGILTLFRILTFDQKFRLPSIFSTLPFFFVYKRLVGILEFFQSISAFPDH